MSLMKKLRKEPVYTTTFTFNSVVVIESLPPGEFRSGRDLFETTMAPAAHADPGLLCDLYQPTSRLEFLGVLRAIQQDAQQHDVSPIIHIETHGDEAGIGLADGELILWSDIADALKAINEASQFNLLVVAAMCHGWHMIDILRPTDRAPAFGIVATRDTVAAGDLLTIMQAFYSALLRPGHDLRAALIKANGTGEEDGWNFEMIGAEVMLCRIFSHYLETLSTEETQTQRVNRLVADLARAQNLDIVHTMELRGRITAALDNHEAWFNMYRTRFLMLDRYPENSKRFPLRYADCSDSR
jgi:hypothetical protein